MTELEKTPEVPAMEDKDRIHEEQKVYDIIVVGGGPCGCTAALYGGRAGLSVLVVEALAPGGQMATTDRVENYPGFPQGIGGYELAEQMKTGAERFGAEFVSGEAKKVELGGKIKKIYTNSKEYWGRSVILATGASPRELGLPLEKELRGRGVSYCATCDGMFYRGKKVAIIGGGDTAAADAVYLSRICEKVTMIHRRDTLRASRAYLEPLKACSNVEILWNTVAEEILQEDGKVKGMRLKNVSTGENTQLLVDGIFVAVGNVPNSGLFADCLRLDSNGYIMADSTTRTAVQGVFAAGDVRRKSLRQIVTAVSDGAQAALAAEEYIASQF